MSEPEADKVRPTTSSLKQSEGAGTFQDWLRGAERNRDKLSPEFREWLERRKAES